MTAIPDHDAYIAAVPEAFRPELQRLREIAGRVLPDQGRTPPRDVVGVGCVTLEWNVVVRHG